MPEPLKNEFNKALIASMARYFIRAWPKFDAEKFVSVACDGMADLELKQRSDQIVNALETCLPNDFKCAAAILFKVLPTTHEDGLKAWAIMPLNTYVGRHGLAHFDLSMSLMKAMTPHFTSEFGIRYFIIDDQSRAFRYLSEWARDKDYRVRRLASEGCRPRLPWAIQLPNLIANPAPILPILEFLKDDKEEYVRRSVANNLNDIAKDHPDLVAEIVAKWMAGASPEREKLLRHASRTLLKQGYRGILRTFGFDLPQNLSCALNVGQKSISLGDTLTFELELTSKNASTQNLMVDYAVHHMKANGALKPKMFKLKVVSIKGGETLKLKKRHPMRKITTRQYYPGKQELEIFLNGQAVAKQEFVLNVT